MKPIGVKDGEDFDIRLIVMLPPLAQKNDLEIKKFKISGKMVSAIGHSKRFERAREATCIEMFKQFTKLGYRTPINQLLRVDFVWYVKRAHEPDWDNLPSMYLDAMQGVKIKNLGLIGKIIENDKLVRKGLTEKIVEGDEAYHGEPRAEIRIRKYYSVR